MPLGADDVETAHADDPLVLLVGDLLRCRERGVVRGLVDLGRVQALLVERLGGEAGRVAAQQDVRAATGHVRRDRDRARPTRLGDDPGFLLVELRVQRLVADAATLEHRGQDLGLLHADRADEDRTAGLVHLDDLLDQRVELAQLVPEDEVRLILANHRAMGRDRDDLELVDLVELLGLGHRRAGHARELVVQAEVVLERDRRERHGLALDLDALLRLDRLVKTLGPAATRHLPAGELVDDDDLAVLDDVVAIALVQGMGAERLLEVAREAGVGVVEVLDPEELLDLVDAFLGRRDGAVLEVDEEVAALLLALGTALQPGNEPREGEVQIRRFLGLAADDQRRPCLVDEDVVDLVDDRVGALPLDPLGEVRDHVVAEIVEAELVVRAVGDVGGVGLLARHRPKIHQPLVRRGVTGLEDEGCVVGDHPDADPEEMEDRSHPLRVAAGEIVVDGDDENAAAGQRVERRREGRDEGLAFARLHLGDLPLVEDDAADELDVEVAHAEGPAHRLAGHREDVGQNLVEGRLDFGLLALAARLRELPASLQVGVGELLLGRLAGLRDLVDLLTDVREPLTDLVVAQGRDLGLELVGFFDQGFDSPDLSIVRVDEAGKETHGGRSIRAALPKPAGRGSAGRGAGPPVVGSAWRRRAAGHLLDIHPRTVGCDRTPGFLPPVGPPFGR